MDREAILKWAKEEARVADDKSHDLNTGDMESSRLWGRAAVLYELIQMLEASYYETDGRDIKP